jgi:inner membrane protein
MNPFTHLLFGWSVANVDGLERRDRLLVTIGGILPDIDSFGIIPEIITHKKLDWFSRYHHLLAHNLLAAIVGLVVVILIARKRVTVGILFFLAFHIHLLCDILGGRGPDGYQWPIPYLWPFSSELQITWLHQWALNAWPNMAITVSFIIITIWLARLKGYSIMGLVSPKLDNLVVKSIRQRFPQKIQS